MIVKRDLNSFVPLKLSNRLNSAKIYIESINLNKTCLHMLYIPRFMNLLQIYLTGFNSFCMIAAVKRLQRQVANNH